MSEFWSILVLGIVQGIAEFLPISSSGHLCAFEVLLHTSASDQLTVNIALHFATLLAVLIFYRRDIAEILLHLVKGGRGRGLALSIVIGCIPAGIAGVLIKSWVEVIPTRWPHIISVCWLLTAVALASLRGRYSEGESEVSWRQALWIGCWQVLALLPGVSRSGITIAAALWVGVSREAAARFSFLVAIPLIAGATGLEVLTLATSERELGVDAVTLTVASVVAFGVGLAALSWLLRLVRHGSLHWWSAYLVLASIAFSGAVALRSSG